PGDCTPVAPAFSPRRHRTLSFGPSARSRTKPGDRQNSGRVANRPASGDANPWLRGSLLTSRRAEGGRALPGAGRGPSVAEFVIIRSRCPPKSYDFSYIRPPPLRGCTQGPLASALDLPPVECEN